MNAVEDANYETEPTVEKYKLQFFEVQNLTKHSIDKRKSSQQLMSKTDKWSWQLQFRIQGGKYWK